MVRRDADERANLQAQLAATAQRVQLQQEQMKSQHQAAAEQMQLQQQAAEEKLRQAELLAEEKRQRTVSVAAIAVHYYQSDHPQSDP